MKKQTLDQLLIIKKKDDMGIENEIGEKMKFRKNRLRYRFLKIPIRRNFSRRLKNPENDCEKVFRGVLYSRQCF